MVLTYHLKLLRSFMTGVDVSPRPSDRVGRLMNRMREAL